MKILVGGCVLLCFALQVTGGVMIVRENEMGLAVFFAAVPVAMIGKLLAAYELSKMEKIIDG